MKSFGIVDVALSFIKQKVDRTTIRERNYQALINQCYKFLVVFVRKSFINQVKIYDDVDVFMKDIDKY